MRRAIVRAEVEATSARSARPHAGVHLVSPDLTPTQACSPAEASTKPPRDATPRPGARGSAFLSASTRRPRVPSSASHPPATTASGATNPGWIRSAYPRMTHRGDARTSSSRTQSDVPRPSASPQPPNRTPSLAADARHGLTDVPGGSRDAARRRRLARARAAARRAAVIPKAKPADAAESDEHAAARLEARRRVARGGGGGGVRRRAPPAARRDQPAEALYDQVSAANASKASSDALVLRRRRGVGERAEHDLARGQEGGEGGEGGGGGGSKLRAAMEESAAPRRRSPPTSSPRLRRTAPPSSARRRSRRARMPSTSAIAWRTRRR